MAIERGQIIKMDFGLTHLWEVGQVPYRTLIVILFLFSYNPHAHTHTHTQDLNGLNCATQSHSPSEHSRSPNVANVANGISASTHDIT